MSSYIKLLKNSFKNNLTFRANYYFGLINTVVLIFVNVAIWKALYHGASEIKGISFSMVVTSFVIGLSFSTAISVDDFMIATKVNSGQIATDLLKPFNINIAMMFQTIGNNIFSILLNFIPALIFASFFLKILPPVSTLMLAYSIIGVALGFFILYNISYIVSVLSFWFVNIWSISTIKNVFVAVLSGTMLPLWFMPSFMNNIIKYTPFDVIYFAPIKMYLGQLSTNEIMAVYTKQFLWIAILYFIGKLLWLKGIKKLVVVGG